MATPIRKKSLWQNYDMVRKLVGIHEKALPMVPPERRAKHEAELEESRRDMENLRVRAERVEGPRV